MEDSEFREFYRALIAQYPISPETAAWILQNILRILQTHSTDDP